jgi:transposase
VIDYHTYHQIHHLLQEEGLSGAQIAQKLGVHRDTVRKWLKREKYVRRAAAVEQRRQSKLEAFKGAIARLLAAHRYTAQQIYQRIQGDGYAGRTAVQLRA